MKFKYVFPAFFLSFSTLFAIENVKIENVIIYQSDAILEGKISKNISKSRSVVFNIPYRYRDLDILENSTACEINSTTYLSKDKLPEYKKLKDEIDRLKTYLSVLNSKLDLLKNYRVKSPNEVDYLAKKIEDILIEKKKVEEKIEKKERALAQLNPIKATVYCKRPERLDIKTYIFTTGFRANPYYILNIQPRERLLNIQLRMKLKSPIKLENVGVVYYGSFRPKIFRRPRPVLMAKGSEIVESSTEDTQVGVVFKTSKNVNLYPNEERDILLYKKDFKNLNFSDYIIGRSKIAYVYTELKSDVDLYPLDDARYYLDGYFVKRGFFKGIHKGEKKKLFLVEDNKVAVDRTKIKDEIAKGLFKKKKTVLFRYSIINNHNYPVKFYLEEYIPPKRRKDLEVKPIYKGVSIYKYNRATGKIIYTFKINGNSKKEFVVGYEMELEK